jgi:MFS family permease
MGIYQSLYSIGMFLGPFISGIIAGMIGVESIFYFAALICFIGMIIGMFITDTLEINEIRN